MNRLSMKITAGTVAAAVLVILLISSGTFFGGADARGADVIQQSSKSSSAVVSAPVSSAVHASVPSAATSSVADPVTLTEKPDPTVVKDPGKLKNSLCSPNAILIRVDDGAILLNKNADQRIFPASMTKIMTEILAIEESPDLNEKVTIPKPLIDELNSQDASMAGFLPGEQVTQHDLLYGVILPSGAECCISLADRLESTEQNYARSMNMKAAELGMKNTHFMNTTGLHDPNHYTTVKDLAVLLDYALRNSTFRKVFTTLSYTTSPTNEHANGLFFRSTMDRCLNTTKAGNATILGGKVGFTDQAGLCLASLAEYQGKEYILVTAGVKNVYRGEIQDAITAYGSLGK